MGVYHLNVTNLCGDGLGFNTSMLSLSAASQSCPPCFCEGRFWFREGLLRRCKKPSANYFRERKMRNVVLKTQFPRTSPRTFCEGPLPRGFVLLLKNALQPRLLHHSILQIWEAEQDLIVQVTARTTLQKQHLL